MGMEITTLDRIIREWEESNTNRKSRKITCADLVRNATTGCGYCKATAERLQLGTNLAEELIDNFVFLGDGYYEAKRCIDVPVNVCRMKPIDTKTGKPVRRKFVINMANDKVPAKWW